MKICFVLLHHDGAFTEPKPFFAHAPLMLHFPAEVAARGHEVDVVILFPSEHRFDQDGVRYHFVAVDRPFRGITWSVGRIVGRPPARNAPALRAIRTVQQIDPDIIHFHGTNLYLNHHLLLSAFGKRRPRVVVHHHGGQPSPNRAARLLQRRNLSKADRLLFTSLTHARPFVERKVIRNAEKIVAFMETSTPFQRRNRSDSRAQTRMHGDPLFVWTGRLDANKDPMTALRGFELVLRSWPDARLYFHYLTDELLGDLQRYVADRPVLQQHVEFRGRVASSEMESIVNSADFLLQASHHEHSGYAVLEAMACGVIPVVTDIPSFRTMTGDGRHGVLFPVGDAAALARGVTAIPRAEWQSRADEVHGYFQDNFSFSALADKLERVYTELDAVVPADRRRVPQQQRAEATT